MHAVHVSVTVPEAEIATARSMLETQIVPMVKAAPGFVAGYWLAPVDGRGLSIAVFETEAQARAVAPPVGPNGPVMVDSVEVREVIASA